MNILYVTSEAVPFCKTGGLADVAGSLPQALAANGDRALQWTTSGLCGRDFKSSVTAREKKAKRSPSS